MAILGGKRTTVTGVARNVTWRESQITFRVEQVDDVGNVTGYVSVEGTTIESKDMVTDGDTVEVTGTLNENEVLELKELENQTTGATFTLSYGFLRWIVLGIVLSFMGVVPGAMIGSFVAPFSGGPAVGALIGLIVVFALGLAYVLRKRSKYTVSGDEGTQTAERRNRSAPLGNGKGEDESE